MSADATGQGKEVRWLVLVCMAIASNPGGCATAGQHVYSYGPVYTWP